MRYQTSVAVSPIVGIVNVPGRSRKSRKERMRVRVVMEVDLPRESARRQITVLRVSAGPGILNDVTATISRIGDRRVIVPAGGFPETTVSTAGWLGVLPNSLETMQTKLAPLSARLVVGEVECRRVLAGEIVLRCAAIDT